MKSAKKKIDEGRCLGIGPDYVPFITVEEARSIGTATRIPDPIEGRDIHTLSVTETMLYWHLRWDDNVRFIREQFLLDKDRINLIREKLGLPKTGSYYSTDFLVDYRDGSQKAFSVKWRKNQFNRNSTEYEGSGDKYCSLINRQNIERIYWESLGIEFAIVTSESLNRTKAVNIETVMSCYKPLLITNEEQMLLYLIAHKYISVPMDEEYINPSKLLKEIRIDVKRTYRIALEAGKRIHERQ